MRWEDDSFSSDSDLERSASPFLRKWLGIKGVLLPIRGGSRMGTKQGLNNKDLGLELEINGDLRLINSNLR
jgi:hypothetical protein